MPPTDPEKAPPSLSPSPPSPSLRSTLALLTRLETRGIQRVLPSESTAPLSWRSHLQAFVLWVSINLAAVNITLGMLAPTVFGLGFGDAAVCAVGGSAVGSAAVAYVATWGPRSGCRTMIFARYTMGWWPGKLVVLLNLIVLLGYSMIDCVVAGQILSAVSPNRSMSVVVGIIIVAVITWMVTTFGIRVFHYYERYAFLPQLVVICILYGVSAKNFDLTTPSIGDPRTVAGNRLSFLSLCLSAAITYAGVAADYFVYYPPATPPLPLFALSLLGLLTSFTLALLIGIGLATGIPSSTPYATAYSTSQGALLVEAFAPLGAFGRFCAVVIALGLIANLIPPTYSSGVDFQLLARKAASVPRWCWNSVGVLVYTVCALAGRDSLAEIFTNFLALMGYWVAVWVALTGEEHLLFRGGWAWATSRLRRTSAGLARAADGPETEGVEGVDAGAGSGDETAGLWNWTDWDRRERLPLGVAALTAFLVGWAGAILCMAQVWYVGPIARLVGDYGADMGNYVGFCWAALVYPPLRWWELRRFGR